MKGQYIVRAKSPSNSKERYEYGASGYMLAQHQMEYLNRLTGFEWVITATETNN